MKNYLHLFLMAAALFTSTPLLAGDPDQERVSPPPSVKRPNSEQLTGSLNNLRQNLERERKLNNKICSTCNFSIRSTDKMGNQFLHMLIVEGPGHNAYLNSAERITSLLTEIRLVEDQLNALGLETED